MVPAAYRSLKRRDQPGQLKVRELVPADRDEVAVAEQDVGGLVDGIGEQQAAHPAPRARGVCFGLNGRIAAQLGDRHQAEERHHELVERGDRAVREDGRTSGIDAGRQVVQDHLPNAG